MSASPVPPPPDAMRRSGDGADAAFGTQRSDVPLPPPDTPNVSLAVSTWALFVGLSLMLIGAGVFGTLVAVRGELAGFTSVELGLIGGAYYLGFLAGTAVAIRAVGSVGHIRVYAALAALFGVTILVAAYFTFPMAWIVLRFIAGACLAGQYVVSESWLNAIVANERRGVVLSAYTTVTAVAFGIGQFSFTRFDPLVVTGFVAAAALVSLAVVPVALSVHASPPVVTVPERMGLRDLWSLVPTGVVTSFLVGIAHGALIGLSAVYASRVGLSVSQIGLFVALPTAGSLLLGFAVSKASDGRDRRQIGAVAGAVAAVGGGVLIAVPPPAVGGFLAMLLIGGMTYPLYSIAGAYTNDSVPPAKLTAAAGQLVRLYGAGAFVGPIIAALSMGRFGLAGYGGVVVASHAAVALYLIVRVLQYPASVRVDPEREVPIEAQPYLVPPTAAAVGRRFKPSRRIGRRVSPLRR